MLASAHAALLIGDPALKALEDADEREKAYGRKLIYVDFSS